MLIWKLSLMNIAFENMFITLLNIFYVFVTETLHTTDSEL